jgi:hypothetical protein
MFIYAILCVHSPNKRLKDTYRGAQLIESSVKARYNDIAGSVMAAILSGTEKHQLSLSERRSGTY